jgi:hypothetical protein
VSSGAGCCALLRSIPALKAASRLPQRFLNRLRRDRDNEGIHMRGYTIVLRALAVLALLQTSAGEAKERQLVDNVTVMKDVKRP